MRHAIFNEQPAFQWGQSVPAVPACSSCDEIKWKEGSTMKKVLMGVAALTAMTATPALAAPGDQSATFTVTGSVAAACGAISGGTLDFGSLVASDGSIKAGTVTPNSQAAYCTGSNSTATVSKVNLSANSVATAPTGFVRIVPFTASVTVGGTAVPADGASHAVGAFSGNLVVSASITADPSSKPVADNSGYSGSISVTLSPAA